MYIFLFSLLAFNLSASTESKVPRPGLYKLMQMDATVSYDNAPKVEYKTDPESGDLTITVFKNGKSESKTYKGEGAQTQCIKKMDPNAPVDQRGCKAQPPVHEGNTVTTSTSCPSMNMIMATTKLSEDLYQYVTKVEMKTPQGEIMQSYDVKQLMVRTGECK